MLEAHHMLSTSATHAQTFACQPPQVASNRSVVQFNLLHYPDLPGPTHPPSLLMSPTQTQSNPTVGMQSAVNAQLNKEFDRLTLANEASLPHGPNDSSHTQHHL